MGQETWAKVLSFYRSKTQVPEVVKDAGEPLEELEEHEEKSESTDYLYLCKYLFFILLALSLYE